MSAVQSPKTAKPWTAGQRRQYLALDDFEKTARRRLPHMLYTFIAEGAETNSALRGNKAAYADYALMPRVLRDVSGRSQATTLFGRDYAHPFGIAPMGASAVCAYRADLALGRAAEAAGIPMIVSAASLIPLETIHDAAPNAWFQAYLPAEPERIVPLVERVGGAGYKTLVLTVDVPVGANREHYIRSGFSIPLIPSARLFWGGVSHPRWLLNTLAQTVAKHGMPHIENMDAFRGPPFLSRAATRALGRRDALNWESLALMRKQWPGNLVIKGILSPADAAIARDHGVDGIIVSNHGGRQLDGAAPPLHVLPEIVDKAGSVAVMIDGGIRRGTDVLKAIALGAKFVFLGRPFLYAVVSGGEAAVSHAITLLSEEVDRDMALVGVREIAGLNGELLMDLPRRGIVGKRAFG